MAITNFIPELWSANILLELQKNLVYGSAVNRDYEGDIANYGDTVHITGIAHISIGDYTAHTDITIEPATLPKGAADALAEYDASHGGGRQITE